MTKPKILILGATGLFGGHLAKRLLDEGRFDCVFAGRTEATLQEFRKLNGGEYRVLDRADAMQVRTVLAEVSPFAVIDCAGPYQAYGDDPYHFTRAVIEAGCHYLDIADAGEFVSGFSELDELAKETGVVALSGASSTPAISSAVVDALTADMDEVIAIETAILPGNKAKRTLSVMQAILGQVGQPMQITRHGKTETVRGWGETVSLDLNVEGKRGIRQRLASFVNTPDTHLFPERYNAKTVTFKAGLEVKAFHYDLVLGRMLVAAGILKSLEPMSKFLRWVASWFEWAGSDEGGMKVSVLGKLKDGNHVRREWDLIADDGHGPKIPTLPVSIMLNKLLGENITSGARACLGEFTLAEVEVEFEKFDGRTKVHESDAQTVFQKALGETFDALPAPIAELHSVRGRAVYEGRADVKGPSGLTGWIGAKLVGFPNDMHDIPVRVNIIAEETGEVWERDFDGRKFRSHMSCDEDGYAQEIFGPLAMRLGLELKDDKLLYPVIGGRLFGFLPVPKFLLPISIAHEEVDDQGRFRFDVLLKSPLGARIAHYQGWLVKEEN